MTDPILGGVEAKKWAYANNGWRWVDGGAGEEGAATWVRYHCGVESRSKIQPGTKAAEIWKSIDDRFIEETRLPERTG